MPRSWRSWEDEEIRHLEKLYSDPDKTIKEIAKILNRSFNSVQMKASRMGFTKQPYELSKMRKGNKYRCFGKHFKETCLGDCPKALLCLDEWVKYIVDKGGYDG